MLSEDSKLFKLLKFDKIIKHLVGYVDTKVALTKIEFEERLRDILTNTFHFLTLGVLTVLFFLFFNVGVAILLNQLLESNYAGFLIVSCFYLIIFLIFIFDKDRKIATKITDRIFKDRDNV